MPEAKAEGEWVERGADELTTQVVCANLADKSERWCLAAILTYAVTGMSTR
jgi:hypothetical protein